MYKIFTTILCFAAGVFFTKAGAANIVLEIELVDSAGNKVEQALVRIQDQCGVTDTSFTCTNGSLSIVVPYCSNYQISAVSSGFDTSKTTVKSESSLSLRVRMVMRPEIKKIGDVNITQRAPIIRTEGEKLIVDAASINPGGISTAVELLERCPGLVVDQQNNSIRMKGKNGVMFMVDGRLQPLSGQDLFNLLRSMPSAMVERIELISNPSARYDASGNAGIINIITKKEKNMGWNGTLTSGLGQGRYIKANQGIMASYRNKKFAWNSQYNYAHRRGFNQLYLQRDFSPNDTFSGSYRQRNYLRFPFNNHTFRTGLDYYLNRTTTLGISTTANANLFNPNGINYSDIIGAEKTVVSYFTTTNNSRDRWFNGSVNAYFKKNLDTFGSEFSIDVDAAKFNSNTDQLFTTEYYDTGWTKYRPDYLLAGDLNGALSILAVKSDYVKKFRNKKQVETGIKASRVIANNHVKFFDQSNQNSVLDSSKSNHFIYAEHIIAAYLQTAGEWNKISYQFGLRGEQTLAEGVQKYSGEAFDRNYLQLFPSFSLQRSDAKNNTTGITLSRRINRPSYGQLNPFKFYLDPTTYRAGNPYLNPELTWSAEMQWVKATGMALSLSLSRTVRNITEVIYPSEEDPKITIQTNKNLRDFRNAVVSFSSPLKTLKNSSGFFSVNAGYQYFTGNIANTPLGKGSFALNANLVQNFVLGKKWAADCNGSYQSEQVYGYMRVLALGQLGGGITRFFWSKTGTLKLAVTDVFFTGNPRGITDFEGYHEEFVVKRETRVAMLTFTYKFGKPQGQTRQRRGGAEEEKSRAQGALG
jgi:hypothetical protein